MSKGEKFQLKFSHPSEKVELRKFNEETRDEEFFEKSKREIEMQIVESCLNLRSDNASIKDMPAILDFMKEAKDLDEENEETGFTMDLIKEDRDNLQAGLEKTKDKRPYAWFKCGDFLKQIIYMEPIKEKPKEKEVQNDTGKVEGHNKGAGGSKQS